MKALLDAAKSRVGNLLKDVTELEGLLAAVLSLSGTATALASSNPQAERIVGAVLAVAGTLAIVLKKAADALRGLQ